jgi:hypothetical protein
MDKLLNAILTLLQADATLTALVSAENIRVAYQEEARVYPSIVILLPDSPPPDAPDNILKANIPILVYSQTNNLNCIEISNRIKALLHKQQATVTDASCVVHVLRYNHANRRYSMTTRTWMQENYYYCVAEDVS